MPGASAFVLTVSDRGAAGERIDASGAALAARLAELGFAVERGLVADDVAAISAAVVEAAARHSLLPGSPRGAIESLAVVEPLLDHALATLSGPFEHERQGTPGS
ncbi:MAG: putative molybdopterin binding domain [Chloroflexi bacterium]|nr:putative molybdopterin binding domain [Chloroflexota bacterium]